MLVRFYHTNTTDEQYIELYGSSEKGIMPEKFQDFFVVYRGTYTNSFRLGGAKGFLMINGTHIIRPQKEARIKIGLHLYKRGQEQKSRIIEKEIQVKKRRKK